MRAELVIDARADLGEGPVWCDGCLWWVNLLEGSLHRYDPTTDRDQSVSVGQPVGAVIPRDAGGWLLAVRDGFAEMSGIDGKMAMLVPVEADDERTRMNDAKADARGRVWASTMAFDAAAGAGTLYRLDADRTATSMVGGLSIGNGLAWSADATQFYFIDSMTNGVDIFDFDAEAGTLSERRQLFAIDPDDGLPDGMTIDAEGGLWVALFAGGVVRRYTATGTLDDVIEVPVPNVTCCTFGGPDLADLYITTARLGLTEADTTPHAGAVFVARPGVSGVPVDRYAG